jgi:hypothetical protein
MDNRRMSTPARPTSFSFRVRRNFKSRDWTSIGLRGARAPVRTASIPKTAALQGIANKDESRMVGFDAQTSNPPPTFAAPSEKDWSEWLWIGLIAFAIAAVAAVQVMQ